MSTDILPDPTPILTPSLVVVTLLRRCGIRATGKLDAALRGTFEWFVWHGRTPGDDEGMFWIPALFPCRKLPEALRAVRDRRRGLGRPDDDASCRQAMAEFHSGLGKTVVGKCPFAFVEIDHLARADQEARYSALSAATGLRWCLQVFSGGKSIHAYLAFTEPLDAADPLREQIQRLLVVCLEGDTRITDPGRLMRLPGWDGAARKQPVVHFDADAHLPAVDVRDRLLKYAASLGIGDVDVAFRTLELAEAVELKARHDEADGSTDAAFELREHAAVLRATRASPSDDDIRLGRAMIGNGVRLLSVGVAGPSRPVRTPGSSSVHLTAAEMAAYEGLPRLTSVRPPCCTDNPKPKGSVLSEPNTPWGPVVWCHKHDTRFVVGFGRGEDLDLDAILGTVDAVPAPVVDREAEWESDRRAGLVPDLVLFSEAMGDALVEHPFVLREVEQRQSARRLERLADDDFLESMSAGRSRGEIHKSPADIDPADAEGDVEAALDLLGGTTWVICNRGPWAYRPAAGGYSRWRIPCKSSTCVTCGPWMMAARRAAAVVVLGNLGRSGWSGTDPTRSFDASDLRAVRRWAEASVGSRAWIRARHPDGSSRDMVLSASVLEMPEPSTAIGKLLLGGRLRSSPFLEGWASDAIPIVDATDEWKGVRVLTGSGWLLSRIHGLRDRMLRRAGDGKTRVTVAPPFEVTDRIERAAGGLSHELKSTGRYVRHQIDRLTPPPTAAEMERIFADLDDGTWRRGRKEIAVVADAAFTELSMASK